MRSNKWVLSASLLAAVLLFIGGAIAFTACEKGICLSVVPKKDAIGTPAKITVSNTRKDPIQVTIIVRRPGGGTDTVVQSGRIEAGSSKDYKYENTSEVGIYTATLVSGSTTLTETFEKEKRPLPDLTITALGADQKARCSWEAEIWARVRNIGDTAASNIVVAFYVDGTRLATPTAFSLDPGRDRLVSVPWTIPRVGGYTLQATVDPDNAIKESNETNNESRKTISVEVQRECARWEDRCVRWERQCVREECVRWERRCVRYNQRGDCVQWQDVCVERRCVEWRDVCVQWERVCVEWRDCPYIRGSFSLADQASREPWSGWWWPLRDSMDPNMYDEGGPLDKYDHYVLASRGYNPEARQWELKAQGSELLIFTLEVKRDDLKGSVQLGKHGRPVGKETIEALRLLKELITTVIPSDRLEEEIQRLEAQLYLGGLWWDGFKGDISSLKDLLANAWKIRSEERQEAGDAPAWMGLCDGWANAAMMEPEPTQARILYGIEFTTTDLKGLLTKAWQQARYELWEPTPKNFHEKLQEVITERRMPLIMDLAPGRMVSSHPAYRYELIKVEEEGPTATFEAKVWFASFAPPDSKGIIPFVQTFRYQLTFDDNWNIIGAGAWIGVAPDQLWVPTTARPGNPKLDLEIIQEINAEVVVTLRWDKKVNLDLRVIGPEGEISKSSSLVGKGRLDRDIIEGGPGSTESIFWPQEKAPTGHYVVIVEYTSEGADEGPTPYEVRVVVGQQVQVYQGILEKVGEGKEFLFTKPGDATNNLQFVELERH